MNSVYNVQHDFYFSVFEMYFCTFQVLNCNKFFELGSLICTNCFVYTSGWWSLKSCLNLNGSYANPASSWAAAAEVKQQNQTHGCNLTKFIQDSRQMGTVASVIDTDTFMLFLCGFSHSDRARADGRSLQFTIVGRPPALIYSKR